MLNLHSLLFRIFHLEQLWEIEKRDVIYVIGEIKVSTSEMDTFSSAPTP
jgi:hypothetical protein